MESSITIYYGIALTNTEVYEYLNSIDESTYKYLEEEDDYCEARDKLEDLLVYPDNIQKNKDNFTITYSDWETSFEGRLIIGYKLHYTCVQYDSYFDLDFEVPQDKIDLMNSFLELNPYITKRPMKFGVVDLGK